MKAINLKW